jgi:hypothetical protein
MGTFRLGRMIENGYGLQQGMDEQGLDRNATNGWCVAKPPLQATPNGY